MMQLKEKNEFRQSLMNEQHY